MRRFLTAFVLLAGGAAAHANDRVFSDCPYIYDGDHDPWFYGSTPADSSGQLPPTLNNVFDTKVVGHYLYAATQGGLKRVDLDNPSAAPTTFSWSTRASKGMSLQTSLSTDPIHMLSVVEASSDGGYADVLFVKLSASGLVTDHASVSTMGSHFGKYACRFKPGPMHDLSTIFPGTIAAASDTWFGLVVTANECLDADYGTVDTWDTSQWPPAMTSRVLVDGAPAGLEVTSNRVYVAAEHAGPVSTSGTVGSHTGSLMVFQRSGYTGISYLTAVNPGCTPSRVVVDETRNWVFVSARMSNQVTVFDGDLLNNNTQASASKLATIATGPEPGPIAILDNGQGLAVGNTFRTNDLSTNGVDTALADYPRSSVMVFKIPHIVMGNPDSWQAMRVCKAFGTPTATSIVDWTDDDGDDHTGYAPADTGDFPRNFEAANDYLFTAMYGADKVVKRSLSGTIYPALDSCVHL